MATQRKQYSAACKARGAVAALTGPTTMHEWVGMYGGPPPHITQWTHHLQSEWPPLFSRRRDKRDQDHAALTARLSPPIGPLQVALDWLKKDLHLTVDPKRQLIEPAHPQMRVARQCDLLGRSRSTDEYQAPGERPEH